MRSKSFCFASICFLLLVCLSTSLIGCGQSQPKPSPVHSWIMHHALPLKTTDPRASLNDVEPLEQIVGNASIVGLGEATHGSHEFFIMKQRLLGFLVEKMGFTMFAMEQFNFWMWNTQ